MYSNDMWEFHPENPDRYRDFPLQFWENGKIKIERVTPEHQPMLTTWYTEHAVDFIQRNKSEPFLLYVPHSMPHVPLFCSEKFKGKSGAGLYGDVMMEIDWSVGEITKALKSAGVEDNTLVIFTSDNGPWTSYGNHAGKTPYREAKGTGFDGGTRSACLMRYPGKIKAGSVSKQDLLHGGPAADHRRAGGRRLAEESYRRQERLGPDHQANPAPRIRTTTIPFSTGPTFEGVISGDGRWKLHIPHSYRVVETVGNDGAAGKYRQEKIELSLFDMEKDPFETTNVIDKYPDVAARMKGYAEAHRAEFYS